VKAFPLLPNWASTAQPFWANGISGADPEPPPDGPDDNPPGDPAPGAPQVVALTPAEISEMIGGIVSQLNAPGTTDAEKAQLQKDLADAQKIIDENAAATASAAQRASREHTRKLNEAQREADKGKQAIAFAQTLGVKHAIEHLTDKDGKSKYVWQDTDTVYALLDHSKIEFDFDKGEAKGLEAQLDDLAKKKPFLLKQGQQQQPQVPPGQQPPPGQPQHYAQFPGQSPWGSAFGSPPSGGNSGDTPEQKSLEDYSGYPAYRNTLGRLAGRPIPVGVETYPVPTNQVPQQQ
jgi:hypothetical protein